MARHIVANFLNLLIILLFVVGGVAVWGKREFSRPQIIADATVFEVKPGDRLNSTTSKKGVAERLQEENIISNQTVFRVGARYSGKAGDLKVGKYAIASDATMVEILDILTSGVGIRQNVTIPEGFSVFQVVDRLNAVEDLTGEITTIPEEGAIAPNTYDYTEGGDRQEILDRMVEAQISILDAAWEKRQADLPLKNKREVLIMASIIEKETGVGSEREEVSAVFNNRLNKGMKLQTDPTVIYGITLGKTTLGRGLRRSELLKKTPYNTYIIPALPPTPIANPGKAAIEAAVNPNTSDNLFFVANGEGGHAFAETLVEHNRNVAKWRAIEKKRKANADQN
jgi:UPF0755 protein